MMIAENDKYTRGLTENFVRQTKEQTRVPIRLRIVLRRNEHSRKTQSTSIILLVSSR